jgi:hypothetical protein
MLLPVYNWKVRVLTTPAIIASAPHGALHDRGARMCAKLTLQRSGLCPVLPVNQDYLDVQSVLSENPLSCVTQRGALFPDIGCTQP